MVVQLTALGVGGGLVVPTVTAQLLGSVDRAAAPGVAGGTLNTLRQTGSAVGVALFGSLLAGGDGFVDGARPRSRSRSGSDWRSSRCRRCCPDAAEERGRAGH